MPKPASEAGPSRPKLPPLLGMDDAAGSAEWGKKKAKRKAEAVEDDGDAAVPADGDEETKASAAATRVPKKKKKKTVGVVYISRLPPGMTPHKVRHLMAKWGDVGRVYAQRRDGYNPNAHKEKQKKHQSANFDEAWVEFMDKNIAKTVAGMLNAQPIGGKKGDRWRDDIWTMKYLSGFKWEMLGEQVAYERNVHQSRLRAEITRAKAEQNSYLQNVELARVLKKREEKAQAAEVEGAEKPARTSAKSDKGDKGDKGKRSYRQREVVDRAHGLEAKGMDSVLGSIFG